MTSGSPASVEQRPLLVPAVAGELWLAHRELDDPARAADDTARARAEGLWHVGTCLREVWLGIGPPAALPGPGLDLQHGDAARALALEILTGLRSAVPGETNVFGQFRSAWDAFRGAADARAVAGLAPHVHRLFQQARQIRRDYLEGIGGASYGSLVRRLLSPQPGERVLFVGTGELTRSMLPLFRHCALGAWNHRPSSRLSGIELRFAPAEGPAAAAWADHVILTTPPDSHNDERWRGWLTDTRARTLVHLGHRGSGPAWPAPLRAYDLDDVFALRARQANIRSLRLEQARQACRLAAREPAPGRRAPARLGLASA